MSTKDKHPRERQARTVDEFEKSSWVKKARDSGAVETAILLAPNIIKRVGKNSKVAQQLAAVIELYRGVSGKDLLTSRNLLLLGGAILYLVCPLDAVPDPLPVIGWLEDLAMVALVLRTVLPSKPDEEDPGAIKDALRSTMVSDVVGSIAGSLPHTSDSAEKLEDT